MSVENKSQQDETDHDEEEDEDNALEKSTRRLAQTRQQSSSHIMSNALQLVYSQEKRNAQTDRFNLDQLTAYLAMKWTDTVDHYEQGNLSAKGNLNFSRKTSKYVPPSSVSAIDFFHVFR